MDQNKKIILIIGIGTAVAGVTILGLHLMNKTNPTKQETINNTSVSPANNYTYINKTKPSHSTNNYTNASSEPASTTEPASTEAVSSITQSTNQTTGMIAIYPSTINLIDNNFVTITGTGYTPNSTGRVEGGSEQSDEGIGLGLFTANSNGNWTITIHYIYTKEYTSSLANIIQDNKNSNYIYIHTHDYTNNKVSNYVSLYF